MSSLILSAMETALCNLATNDKNNFSIIFKQLKDSPYETVQFLLIRGLKDGGEDFADIAIEYLLTDKSKFKIGWFNDYGWATRELITIATTFCSNQSLLALEIALLSYYTDYEKSARSYSRRNYQGNRFGYSQFTILCGIDKNRQSLLVKKRLQEWQRKFNKDTPEPPQGIIVGWITSPIKKQDIDRMADQHWLQAIKRYDSSNKLHNYKDGAELLSRDLESQTKIQPERFARLALTFPRETHHDYFNAVIRGLNEATIDLALLIEFCCYCHELPNKPCGRSLPRLIAKYKEQALPDSLLDIVTWYALHDPDPDNSHSIGNDLRFEAINSVRGIAVEVIADLMFTNKRYENYFFPLVEYLVQDPSAVVRSQVFKVLIAVINIDYAKSNQLFRDLLASDDRLLATRWIEDYLNYAVWQHFASVKDILERFIGSENDIVKAIGTRQTCVASLNNEAANTLVEQCLQGNKAMRLGVAEVFSANIKSDTHRAICIERLNQLFNDEDQEVRNKAASCFWHIKDDDLSSYQSLIDSFMRSTAIQNIPPKLIQLLEQAVNRLPDTVIDLIECYRKKQGQNTNYVFYEINRLLIRLYLQSKDPAIQKRCLDALDAIVGYGAMGLSTELLSFDR